MATVTLDMLFGNTGATPAVGQTVRLGYGKANFADALATYSAMRVQAPFKRETAINSGKRHGQQQWHQMGAFELNGGVAIANVEHPNGTVIMVTMSQRRKGASIRDGALFMRLRVGAPLWSVHAKVPTHVDNLFGDQVEVFQGYADIMNADELGLIGIKVNESYVNKFMAEDELNECFVLSQLQSERVPRPQLTAISTPTGVEMREVPATPSRRMNVRRRV